MLHAAFLFLLPQRPAASAHHLLGPSGSLPADWALTTLACLPAHPSAIPTMLSNNAPASQGYLRAVEALRQRLMASEWELGLRPIALQL